MRIADTQLVRAIHELSTEEVLSAPALGQVLKQFLMRKRLTKRMGKVLRAYERYAADQAGLVIVEATTAHSLSEVTKRHITEEAQTLFGTGEKQTQVMFHIDQRLLGGVRLETDTLRYDCSLTRTLNELRKSFSH